MYLRMVSTEPGAAQSSKSDHCGCPYVPRCRCGSVVALRECRRNPRRHCPYHGHGCGLSTARAHVGPRGRWRQWGDSEVKDPPRRHHRCGHWRRAWCGGGNASTHRLPRNERALQCTGKEDPVHGWAGRSWCAYWFWRRRADRPRVLKAVDGRNVATSVDSRCPKDARAWWSWAVDRRSSNGTPPRRTSWAIASRKALVSSVWD